MSTTENGAALPLRPALRGFDSDVPMSPKSGPAKVVSIAESEEEIPPASLSEEASRPKIFTASTAGRRLTGRPTMTSSRASITSLNTPDEVPSEAPTTQAQSHAEGGARQHHVHRPRIHHNHVNNQLLTQVAEWLQAEKAKRAAKKSKRRGGKSSDESSARGEAAEIATATARSRTSSQSSDGSAISLERLQRILEDNMSSFGVDQLPGSSTPGHSTPRHTQSHSHRRRPSLRKLGAGSSDTEYHDGDVVVPSCDVVLDNSKTMSYSGGVLESSDTTVTLNSSKRAEKERKAWSVFKKEIVTIAHTLRLKGWRKVAIDSSGDIEVERLSGALTNAVYVVSSPKKLDGAKTGGKMPDKLLLRIYGPQVEHLIDRENELGILRRLARKKIGPRLLGTFENGRFEEFFNAQTLTPEDLVDPNTSKQIAKRMRELHDGIDLLEREREEGPFVWLNWDKWVDKCEEVITYLDREIASGNKGSGEGWRRRGLICGVEWPLFKSTVDKYRKWLVDLYGKGGIESKLVFAHNDTQYGNILRLVPEKAKDGLAPSPLLLPQNTHKQLIVIDFEYASANLPGLEFANHFTEWCYNYHDPKKAWACQTSKYPTVEEQKRFIKSYVNHRPQFNPKASATPKMTAMDGSAKGSISEFLLDSRTPGGSMIAESNYVEEERKREEVVEKQVLDLCKETRLWRVANSAQWVAWGIVQAKIPELDVSEQGAEGEKEKGDDEDEDEFDYLAYAQDRAMFFWGDVVGLGLVKKEELPELLRERLKIVEY